VDEVLDGQQGLQRLGPGRRLLLAITEIFDEARPSIPPRRGLRLDTRWAEFGLLAARYFAPLKYGTPFPTSMRDAWGRIDQSILLFVYGPKADSAGGTDAAKYELVGREQEVAAESTLSDWHRNGLQRLALAIEKRRQRVGQPSSRSPAGAALGGMMARLRRVPRRMVLLGTAALISLIIIFGVVRAYGSYVAAQNVLRDFLELRATMPSSPSFEAVQDLRTRLPVLRRDLDALHAQATPFLWLAPLFRGVPTYGGDLARAGDLLDVARHLTASADIASTALAPLLDDASSSNSQFSLDTTLSVIENAQPQFSEAEQELAAARAARERIDPAALSPRVRDLLTGRVDQALGLMDAGLTVGASVPTLVGAGPDGPKTYLLLVQNEDELRPTGGLITAVGKLVLSQGHIVDLSFEDSGEVDNWAMPYPMAPWQLQEYMNSRVLVLRDANWFTDFPTALLYIRQLYAYSRQSSVDGVIAFDQQLLLMLLQAVGPVQVKGVDEPVGVGNVNEYMQLAKKPPPGVELTAAWREQRKAFMGLLAHALLQKVMNGNAEQWRALPAVAYQALEQRHLLLQMDDPTMRAVLERRGWNGAVVSPPGDFLMLVDTNVGFNKTNAVVDTRLTYSVDLSDPSAPASQLDVSHINHASAKVQCVQWDKDQPTSDAYYPIDRCYWDYMRVYTPQGSQLLSATPESIPDAWMILNRHVVPRVDVLEEGIPGLASFGTMLVVPGSEEVRTSMNFALPASTVLLRNSDGSYTYSLKIKKQPGTLAMPVTVRLQLPARATVVSQSPGATREGQSLVYTEKLQVDRQLDVVFRSP